MSDPIQEFIGQQLHSVSNIDAGMLPKKQKGKKAWKWWPYQHHKPSKSFNTGSHEDRLIAAIDKKRNYPNRSRQEVVAELLGEGYRKKEVAEMLKVSHDTVTRDVKKLRLALDNRKEKKNERGNGKKEEGGHRDAGEAGATGPGVSQG